MLIGGVALDVLKQRYSTFRNMISNWLRNKIFAPISQMNEFYEYVEGEKKLIVPDIDWNHMSLFDVDSYINILLQLTTGEGAAKRVSVHTLYKSLGLEWEDEVLRMRKENIQEVIFEKEKEALKKMDLNELRTISDDDEINEVDNGEEGGEGEAPADGALPGEEAGMPDMPPPPPPLPGA